MTNEELVKLVQKGIDVQENMEMLYKQNKSIIYYIVKPYAKMFEIEDLMQESYFGLYNAALKYNINSEYKFISYANKIIKFMILKYCKNNTYMNKIPDYIILLMSKYNKFIKEYENKYNIKPSDIEIIDYLDINYKQLKNLKKWIEESTTVSMQSKLTINEDQTLEDTIADELNLEEKVCENILHEQLKKELWNAVDKLPEKTSNIFKQKYKNNKKIKDIAKEQRISYQRIGQIEYEGLKILRQKENLKQIANEYYYNTSMGYKGSLKSFKENGGSVVERLVIKKIRDEKQILQTIESIRNKRNKILASLKVK